MATEVAAAQRRIIRRPRLTSILDESSAQVRLLVAPAGYGKTTLAREWLGEPERRDTWYRGGPASADVAALAAGLAEAVSEIVPDAGKRMRDRLRATGNPEEDVDILAELFAADVPEWPDDAWLAFDDYHFAMNSPASERFVDLLTQQTAMQMLITSRRRPTWATARRILYGEILEIDRRTLAMDDAEAHEVIGRHENSMQQLIATARGWPAVLGLASLAEGFTLPDRALPDALYDYFAEELFNALGADVQIGLSQLATIPSLSLDLAGKLLGRNAGVVIEEGVRIGAITRDGSSLDLHPLLSEFLARKLSERGNEDVRRFAEHAVQVLIGDERWDDAYYAISSLDRPELLPNLVEAAFDDLLMHGRTRTLTKWLDFAEAKHLESPVIALAEAEILFREGHYARAEGLALASLDGLNTSGLTAKALIRAGQSALLDSRDADALRSFRHAHEAAATAETQLEALVGECLAILELGRAAGAEEVFRQLETLGNATFEMKVRQATVQLVRAARLGGINDALQLAAEVRPLIDQVKDPVVAASFLNAHAHILVLGARYQDAVELTESQIELARQYRLDFVLPQATLVLALAQSGLREFSRALEAVQRAEEYAEINRDVHILMYAAAMRARVAIHRSDFSEALKQTGRRWARPGSDAMRAELAGYRALAAACSGDSGGAKHWCDEVKAAPGRGVESDGLAVCTEAVVVLNEGRESAAEASVAAFRSIETLGAFDCLVTAARAFPQFLRAIVRSTDDVSTLSLIFSEANDAKLARTAGLPLDGQRRGPISRLTPRELEVAYLVARGHTNRMIADALFISDATVKVHVRHILEKLGARSRAELAARIATLE